jgi:tetratricopeptide (TPR) repeat protein
MAGNKEKFQKLMNQGHTAAWDQDWDKAADFYSAALEETTDHPQALSSLGLALFELQDYPSALQCYKRAVNAAPDDPVPHEKIARIYERMGKLNEAIATSLQAAEMHLKAKSIEKAIDNWTRVLSLQPEHIAVRTKLAAVHERMGQREEAIAEYIACASIFQRSGDLTRAIKVVEHALQVMPTNQEVRLALSMLRSNQLLPRPARPRGGTGPVRMANIRQMEDQNEGEGENEPDPISEARQKAMVQLAGLLFDQAEEAGNIAPTRARGFSALTRGTSDSSSENNERTRTILHLGQAIDSHTQGDYAQAIVELEHTLSLGMRQPAAYYSLGMMLKDDQPDKAMKYLQQSVKHPDYTLASYLLMAQVYQSKEQWCESATAFLQALALADVETVPADQADALLSQYDGLIDSQSSIEENAAHQSACKAISNQLLRTNWRGYLKKVRQQLPTQIEGSPPSPVAEMVLEARNSQVVETMAQVRKLAGSGMLRSAIEEAMYALQYAPNYLPLHVLIGDLLMQDQHVGEAVQKFLVVADLYSVRGEASRAVRMLKRVSQIMPMDLVVRQRLIDLLVAQDKADDALQEYSDLAELYYRLAELDKARQVYLEALKIAQKAKENRDWGVNLLLKVADIDMQRLNLRQALRIYEQIRTIRPDMPTVRAQLVLLNFRLGQEPAAMKELDEYLHFLETANRRPHAIEFISDLLVDYSGNISLRRRLADLYIRSRQVPEAVIQLDTVADALLTAGKHLEAVNILETIISLRPPNVDEYKNALEGLRRDMLRK